MNFIEAIKLLELNKDIKIHRKGTPYILAIDNISVFKCYTLDRRIDEYAITTCDALADDWEIYQEQPKLHTFEEVIVAFRAGKTISREDKNDRNLRYKMGWSKTLHFKEEDLLANDWIIIEG
jgi:hypothetical protein